MGYLHEADGVADTSTTQFFSEEIETPRDHDPKGSTCCWFRTETLALPSEQTMILKQLLLRIASLFARPLTTPTCSHVRTKIVLNQ